MEIIWNMHAAVRVVKTEVTEQNTVLEYLYRSING